MEGRGNGLGELDLESCLDLDKCTFFSHETLFFGCCFPKSLLPALPAPSPSPSWVLRAAQAPGGWLSHYWQQQGALCCLLYVFPSDPMALQEIGSPGGAFGFRCSASPHQEQLHKACCGQMGKCLDHDGILGQRRGISTAK